MYKFAFASLLALASAQSLTDVIGMNSNLSALGTLLQAQPTLLSALANATNITVLAPTNDAIAALTSTPAGMAAASNADLIAAILEYHVIQGTYNSTMIPESLTFVPTLLMPGMYANVSGGQRLGVQRSGSAVTIFSGLGMNSSVTTADVKFNGGVVHVINSVLTVPESASDTAVAAGLTSLAGALTNASLVDTVNGLMNVTIFAPDNAAFQAIGSALPTLSAMNITEILTYHVVVGMEPLYSTSLTTGAQAKTVQGNSVTVTINGDKIFVNGARVIRPNVLIAGGVVHVIDNVLNPYNTTAIMSGSSADMGSVAFGNATGSSDTPFTSGVMTGTATVGSATPTGTASMASTAAAAAVTGAVGAAALFGAGVAMLNL